MPGSPRSAMPVNAPGGRCRARSWAVLLSALAALALVLVGPTGTAAAASQGPASIGKPAAVTTAATASSSALRCASTWKSAGFSSSTAVTATAIGLAESSCTASATNTNGPTSGCPNGSVDRGMWQINSCYHSEVSASCAFDAICNAKAAYRISSSGTTWRQWATYTSGAYKSRLSDAQAAVTSVYGTSGPTAGWPVLRQSSTGWRVGTLQHLLRQQGYALTVDDQFGPATNAAVRSFQSKRGLTVDGIVGTNTWSALATTVRSGSTGEVVRAAQYALRSHGYSLSVDGQFGPATTGAARAFQTSKGLSVDGIIGPNTWRALVS